MLWYRIAAYLHTFVGQKAQLETVTQKRVPRTIGNDVSFGHEV